MKLLLSFFLLTIFFIYSSSQLASIHAYPIGLPDLSDGVAPIISNSNSFNIPNQYIIQTVNVSIANNIVQTLNLSLSTEFSRNPLSAGTTNRLYCKLLFPVYDTVFFGFSLRLGLINLLGQEQQITSQIVDFALNLIARIPGVVQIEQDAIVQGSQSSPAGYETQTVAGADLWGLDRIDQRPTRGDGKYYYNTTASSVSVFVIDTGIRKSHQEFEGRASWGYSAFNDQANCEDQNQHGTHVAGTIGGKTVGIAKKVKLVAVQVLDGSGSGSNSGVISGVNWVGRNAPVGTSVAVMSLGGPASSSLDNAVANAIQMGITFAIAAGNSNVSACDVSPARVATGITVAASDSNDNRASFSNWGTCTHIFAPGVNIKSVSNADDSSFKFLSGTSMAAPHVAGVAALYLSRFPGTSPAQVRSDLVCFSTKDAMKDVQNSPNRLLFSFNQQNKQQNSGDSGNGANPATPEPTPSETCSSSSPCSTASGSTSQYGQTVRFPDQGYNATVAGYHRAWLSFSFPSTLQLTKPNYYLYLYQWSESSQKWNVISSQTDNSNPKELIVNSTLTSGTFAWVIQSRNFLTSNYKIQWKTPAAPLLKNSTVTPNQTCAASVDFDPNPNNPNNPKNSQISHATSSSHFMPLVYLCLFAATLLIQIINH